MSRAHPVPRPRTFVLPLILAAVAVIALVPSRRPPLSGRAPEAGWRAAASAALERMEYRPSVTSDGLQAPNRANGFRTWFHADRVEIVPRTTPAAPWSWSWSTRAFGREGSATAVAPVEPVQTIARVEYAHPGWVEWYENGGSGLEQGFTIAARPAGSGRCCIEGTVGGMLGATAEGERVMFRQADGPAALRYGSLLAIDARGRELPAEIELAENRIRILVDDCDARYPLMIDPLIDVPAWECHGDQFHASVGQSLSTIGDVNGDGFSDFALGLGRYDGPAGANQGRVLVFYGAPSGPSPMPDWFAEGDADSTYFGFYVSTAGDVNGDGYDDLLVSAMLQRHADGSCGSVYVYHGSPSGLTGPVWEARTYAPDTTTTFGYGIAYAGDVNGDGYGDVAIGDFHRDGAIPDAGAVWVYHGSASGLEDSPAWFTEGEWETGYYGASISTAGDVDADGYDDLLVGASRSNDTGKAYLYRGSATGLSLTPSWTHTASAYSYYGRAVALAGDVNGDGYGDVLVGELNAAYLYPGSVTGLGEEIWSREGANPTDYVGEGLGTAGDVNGDGLADFLVGEPHSMEAGGIGQVDLYYGSRLEISTDPDWIFVSDEPESRLGSAVATAGDVNGDGCSDFLVGAPMYDGAYEWEGRAYLFLGSGEGPRTTAGWVVETNQAGSLFGHSIASAGDVNGDGCEEILVGAPGYDYGQADEGVAFLFLGSGAGPSVLPDWWAESNQAGARLGSSVACAGDIDADGYDDVVIGAPNYDFSTYANSGSAFVWRGTPAGPPPSGTPANAAWTGQRAQADAHFGASVACAGDVDGDGYADLLIGVPGHTRAFTHEGAAVIYHGSPSGPPSVPDWTAEGGQAGAGLGTSVSSAGDVNGDLFSDVAVGAPYYDGTYSNEGAVYLYNGSDSGPAHAPSWSALGREAGAHLGTSVAPAGDVNGDGYSDLLVGNPGHIHNDLRCGMAMCWYGSESGPSGASPSEADWWMMGTAAGDSLGLCVAPGGDVDGDGFSDVLIAAPHAEWNGVADAGVVAWARGTADGIARLAATTLGGAQAGANFGASIASADLNGDGFTDVMVGAPAHDQGQADEGRGFVYYGNRSRGLRRSPDQWRLDDSAPVPLLSFTDDWSGFGLHAVGRTAAGRDDVRLEWEVARFGEAFDGTEIALGSTYDTGVPDPNLGSCVTIREAVTGLVGPRGWCWRMRIASRNPYFPRTPWLKHTGNGATEMDLRTPESPAALEDPVAAGVNRLALACRPNPFRVGATIAWMQTLPGEVCVTVHDLEGRLVRRLVDETRDAGEQRVVWDGARGDGSRAPAGIYWIQARVGDEVARARVVRVE